MTGPRRLLPTTIKLACDEASTSDLVALVTRVRPATATLRCNSFASITPCAVTSVAASSAPGSRSDGPKSCCVAIPG